MRTRLGLYRPCCFYAMQHSVDWSRLPTLLTLSPAEAGCGLVDSYPADWLRLHRGIEKSRPSLSGSLPTNLVLLGAPSNAP